MYRPIYVIRFEIMYLPIKCVTKDVNVLNLFEQACIMFNLRV